MKIAPPYWGGHYTQFRGWGEAGALNGCVGGAIRGRRATRHNEVRGFRRFVLFSLQTHLQYILPCWRATNENMSLREVNTNESIK